jgi:hypothetical protein
MAEIGIEADSWRKTACGAPFRNDFVGLRLRSRPRAVSRVARARVSWLISPKTRGTSHLNCHGGIESTLGRSKHFAVRSRPRNLRQRIWPKPNMSLQGRSILINRNGPSPRRRYLNGSKNRMKTTWLEPAGSPRPRRRAGRTGREASKGLQGREMTNKDAFDRWWERAEKPHESMLMIGNPDHHHLG